MGHIRLGRLPKNATWQQLISLLDLPAVDVATVATATVSGAQNRLHGLRRDPVVIYSFWLLTRLATAARSGDLIEQVGFWGLAVTPQDNALSVMAQLNQLVRREVERHPESGPFAEMASLAFRRTLLEVLVAEQQPLFETSTTDLENVLRQRTTNRAFGDLAGCFFGDLLGRTLRFYVDKELPFHVGADSGFPDIAASDDFLSDLDTYSRQSARIVDVFASDWLSKYTFQEQGMISREQVRHFVAYAMEKLDAELRLEPVA